MFKVLDNTCVNGGPLRTHEIIIDGRKIPHKFEYGVPLEMPETHAMKFVHIPEFEVTDKDGNRIYPAISVLKGFDKSEPLAENECVARLDELTVQSLVERAQPLPGGERMSQKDGKAALIVFLISSRKKKLNANLSPEKRESMGEFEQMSAAEEKRLAELEAA